MLKNRYYRVELFIQGADTDKIFSSDANDPVDAACLLWLWAQMEGWKPLNFEIWSISCRPINVQHLTDLELTMDKAFGIV